MYILLQLFWLVLLAWLPANQAGASVPKAGAAATSQAKQEEQYAAGEAHRFRYMQRAAELVLQHGQRQQPQGAEQQLIGIAAGRLVLSGLAGSGAKVLGAVSAKISLGLRSSDIIFPFHYFW